MSLSLGWPVLAAAAGYGLIGGWLVLRDTRGLALTALWSLAWYAAVCLSNLQFLGRLVDRYPGDSFHTLTPLAGAVLGLLSLLFCIAALGAAWTAIRWSAPRLDQPWRALAPFPIVAVCYLIWEFFAPQMHYFYYLIIFEGLPWQWVVQPGQIWRRILSFLGPTAEGSYAADFGALFLHAMILLALGMALRSLPGPRMRTAVIAALGLGAGRLALSAGAPL